MAPDLTFFPYPHVTGTGRHSGLGHDWPPKCISCGIRECESSTASDVSVCRYGISYQRVDDDLLIAGIVIRGGPPADTVARRRQLRRAGTSSVSLSELEAVVARYRIAVERDAAQIIEADRAAIAAERRSPDFVGHSLEVLRPDLQRIFGQVHDYRQFVTQIIQNMNVILEERRAGLRRGSGPDLLEYASHEEEAIYWAARLMESKLNVSLYLLKPELITQQTPARFRLHGLVLKYVRIYQRAFDQKQVRLIHTGESFGDVNSNGEAVGVIPHTFLDNALKYAPRGSSVVLRFHEDQSSIAFEVSGFGPWLYEDERHSIFELFVRGAEAQRVEPEGMGMGLGLASLVADRLNIELAVTQQESRTQGDLYWTAFSARFQRA